jgi:GT2 family glycosyltransferase
MKVMIATPMYGGQCDGAYTDSILKAQKYFAQNGIEMEYNFLFNESLIQRARNRLTTTFLKSDADYLMFIDADQAFEASWIKELMETGKDLIAGVVPMKGLYVDYMIEAANRGKKDIEKYSGLFNYNVIPGDKRPLIVDKPYAVSRVGTGFMCISRKVFEEMAPLCEKYQTTLNYKESIEEIAFFNVRVKNGILMSEDYDFCERWREMGNEVFIAPWICTTHKGSYLFKGHLPSHLEMAREIAIEKINKNIIK